MAGKKVDSNINVAAIFVEEAVVSTQISKKFNFPFSIQDKIALIIERIEYHPVNLSALNSTGDQLFMALAARAVLANTDDQSDPSIIDSMIIQRLDLGAAASGLLVQRPFWRDFTGLTGGGLMVAPGQLYAVCKDTGASGVMSFWMRLYYTYQTLTPDEYWQLVESRNVVTS